MAKSNQAPGSIKTKMIHFRDRFLVGMVDWSKPYYAYYFKHRQQAWKQSTESLKKFPPGSLGNDLGHFLENEGLELMPKLEEHDVMHVLLDYQTTVKDEARMQFFLLGNGKKSWYALVTAMASLILIPEYIRDFINEYRKGRSCRCIVHWNFAYLLSEPTAVLRQLIYRKDVGVEAPLLF